MARPSASLGHLQVRAADIGANNLFVREMLPAIYAAGVAYDIDPTVLAAQSFHETGGGKFGRAVTPGHHNVAGIKVRNPVGPDTNPDDHARFPSWQRGAEAHASHLRAYASVPIEPPLVDHSPRSVWVWPKNHGFTEMGQLGGHYAPSPTYGDRVVAVAQRLLEDREE